MSSPSVSQVRTWSANSHALTDAASSIDGKVDTFDATMNAMTRDVDTVMTNWKGEAAQASQATTDSEKQISNRLGIGILDIADVLNQLTPNFQHACDAANRVAEDVVGRGYVVADNGTVSAPPNAAGGFPSDVPTGATPEEAATIAATNAAAHQRDLQGALAAAGAADADIAARVGKALEALATAADRATASVPVSPEVRAILDGKASLPSDPTQLNHFWNSLSANEKAELWNHNREVGNMDGIPVADRDHFNRRHIAELLRDERHEADEKLAKLGPEPAFHPSPGYPKKEDSPRYKEWKKSYDAALKPVQGLENLDRKLNEPSKNPLFLMTARDNGQVAVAVNNPDTADNVSTYVPGTGTNLSSVGGNVDRANDMVAAAVDADPTARTAVVTWQDYVAPQNPVTESPSIDYARDAAGDLDDFQNGLSATHTSDTPANSSVLGHSYGTTVVATAATGDHILNTDDVIFVASPGLGGITGVDDLNLTGVPSDDMDHRVWSTISELDPMNAVPEFVLGPKPNYGTFDGAQHFDADWSGGHSDYWDEGNSALKNMGYIITGQDSKVDR